MQGTDVILFDRQDITRLGLESLIPTLLRSEEVCRTSTVLTKGELVASLAVRPDAVVVIDYALSDLGSADSLLNIGLRFPAARWILFSDELSAQFLRKMLCEVAFGAVMKTSGLSEIKAALAAALSGRSYVCRQVNELLHLSNRENGMFHSPLTATEREILREIALGRSAKEIAALRSISTHTVTAHRKNLYRKLEVNNSHEAAGYALRAGVVDSSDYFI
jgi:DNA-binding NarL/FixJ family response regulator